MPTGLGRLSVCKTTKRQAELSNCELELDGAFVLHARSANAGSFAWHKADLG